VVEDCGGAIKGNRVDFFFDSHEEALKFGRKQFTIWVKEKVKCVIKIDLQDMSRKRKNYNNKI
jgi:hypothetical protein